VTPVEAITSLAWKSDVRQDRREVAAPDVVGVLSATSSMSMPPMSEKSITGCLRMPSQTTPRSTPA
jgi:hypothetical protein